MNVLREQNGFTDRSTQRERAAVVEGWAVRAVGPWLPLSRACILLFVLDRIVEAGNWHPQRRRKPYDTSSGM